MILVSSFNWWKLIYETANYTNNNLSPNRILVVDDEPDIALSLKVGLENNSEFIVETFNDSIEALSNFKAGDMICCS